MPAYVPRSWQESHVAWAVDKLQHQHWINDLTNTGVGKSAMASIIADRLGLELFIVCPTGARDAWQKLSAHIEKPVQIMTYGELATNGENVISHGLLTKTLYDDDKRPKIDENVPGNLTKSKGKYRWTHYYPTPLLQTIIAAGVLFVFDEAHAFKNDNNRYQAVLAIAQEVAWFGGPSRIIAMSATLNHDDSHNWNLTNLLGYFGYGLKHAHHGQVNMLPLYAIGTKSEREAKQIENDYRDRPDDFVIDRIIKPSTSASGEQKINFKNEISDTYLPINPLLHHKATNNLYRLQELILQKIKGEEKKAGTHRTLETAKIPVVISSVLIKYEEVEGSQFIIGVNYLASLYYLQAMFRAMGYPVGVIEGSVSSEDRTRIVDAFMEADIRIVIMVTRAGGASISLHDVVGGRPRFTYVLPSYHVVDIIQLTGRAYRDGVMSDVDTRVIYTQIAEEIIMRDSTAEKSSNLRRLLPENDNRILPDSFGTSVPNEAQLNVNSRAVRGLNGEEEVRDAMKQQMSKAKKTPVKRRTSPDKKVKGLISPMMKTTVDGVPTVKKQTSKGRRVFKFD